LDLNKISTGQNPPDDVNVVIEVPLGGEPIKYEIDKASGAMFVDRFLYTAMRYPCNYGFIPHTLSLDGDPIDVMCVGNRALVPGSVLRVRPVGVLMMTDDKGEDEKVLAVPHPKLTQYYDKVHAYTDLPDILVQRIVHFFEHYKDLEPGKWVKVDGLYGPDKAREMISAAVERAKR
jgi:inorganic pyrophosphatase